MFTFKIFPATINSENQKVPLIKEWNEKATNDPRQIELWQQLFRDRIKIWGVPCGAVNGIVALDIDVKKVNGWESLQRLGIVPPTTLIQRTPSGGAHLIFKAKAGTHYNNSVNSETGLDTRGDRGWIAWYGDTNGAEMVDVPDWFGTIGRAGKSHDVPAGVGSPVKLAPEIAQGIFLKAIEEVRNAAPGESNNVLNTQSYVIGQLIASGSVARDFAEAQLFAAAKDRGKPDYESKATIKSGLDGGVKNPITSPFGSEAPTPLLTIPDVPGAPERWTPQYMTRADLVNVLKLRKPQLFKDWSTEDIQITTADGGTGKTTLKLFEAICLALGERFLGFENVQRGKTLYITGEDTQAKLAAMIGMILKQMGYIDDEERVQTVLSSIVVKKDADLCLIAKDKQGFLYPNPEAMRKLEEAVNDIRPKMIVFDPIASFWGSENALNDMNKAVTKFMSSLVERYNVCIEMINHMGKSSSANKDMSQFAGRGGSGLPSNSRVSRVMRSLTPDEYTEMTGLELGGASAMLVQVNKFSDGSPLTNAPFVVTRNGFLFAKVSLTQAKAKELENQSSDNEKVFTYVREMRRQNKYPTRNVVIAHFMNSADKMSESRTKRALDMLEFTGQNGQLVQSVANPDITRKDKVLVLTDLEGNEN